MILSLVPLLSASVVFAQQEVSISASDTLKGHVEAVLIHAYESNRDKMGVAMPVAVLSPEALNNFNPQSAVQAINAIPGVHMDERSPSSYRLNIRGSAMRSPFGVRNVKVYYQGIPYTEPGGTSYINQLGTLDFAGAEIVKGPGSSMYGAGTGGVLLLGNNTPEATGYHAGYAYGSFNTHTFFADAHAVTSRTTQQIMYQQLHSDGYRDQSASDRKILNWNGSYRLGEHYELHHILLLGNLYYQTPGALTLKEFEARPESARPAAGSFPSAVQAGAAIWQKTSLSGLSLKSSWGRGFSNETGGYIAYTSLRNATIRNYSLTEQPHGGGRTVFHWVKDIADINLRVHAGGELQTGTSAVTVFDNASGNPGALQSRARVQTTPWFLFLQAAAAWRGWELLMGSSLNNMNLDYQSTVPAGVSAVRDFHNILSPRVSLSKLLCRNAFIYASVSKGFSPPVTDELLPSGGAFNPQLQPEQGVNYELGFRYRLPQRLMLELNGYYFNLRQTIVQRRDAGGGDYYVNSGNTTQPGVEFHAEWMGGKSGAFQWQWDLSYAYQPYVYGDFVREQNDYSGKALPGLSKHNVYLGFHAEWLSHFIFQGNYFYNSRVPLNDLNSEYGSEVQSLSARLGYQLSKGKYGMKLFAGADNILDKHYSLGYDINAAGGRYYNAAPGRSYMVQLVLNR